MLFNKRCFRVRVDIAYLCTNAIYGSVIDWIVLCLLSLYQRISLKPLPVVPKVRTLTSVGYGNYSSNVTAYIPRSLWITVSTGKGYYSASDPIHTICIFVMSGNQRINSCTAGMYYREEKFAMWYVTSAWDFGLLTSQEQQTQWQHLHLSLTVLLSPLQHHQFHWILNCT